jgi:hypothetical protein
MMMRDVASGMVICALSIGCISQERANPPAASPARAAPAPSTTLMSVDSLAALEIRDTTADSLVISADSAGHPVYPITLHDVCEGEDCSPTFTGVVCRAFELHATEQDDSPVVARLAAGDTMAVTGVNYHMTRLGVVVLRRDTVMVRILAAEDDVPVRAETVRVARGDSLYLVRYYELGEWQWWYHGLLHRGEEFWVGPTTPGLGAWRDPAKHPRAIAVALSHPDAEIWHHIVSRSGQSGWLSPHGPGLLVPTPGYDGWNCADALESEKRERTDPHTR